MKEERPKDISRACRLLGTSRSCINYQSVKDDQGLMERLQQLAMEHPREGFWKCYGRIRQTQMEVNHKRLHRVYKQMNLPLRRKIKKRLPSRVKSPLNVPDCFTHTWSIDFMSDALENGRKFRSFNVIDDYNREILFIETDYSIKSSRVIWVLRHLINKHGKPSRIRMDNGPEFIAQMAKEWAEMYDIELVHIQPGKPSQNGFIERFNRSYREGVLDAYLFDNLEEVREVSSQWQEDFNHHRPHESLNGLPPVIYRQRNKKQFEALSGLRSASATPQLHSARKELQKQNKT